MEGIIINDIVFCVWYEISNELQHVFIFFLHPQHLSPLLYWLYRCIITIKVQNYLMRHVLLLFLQLQLHQ